MVCMCVFVCGETILHSVPRKKRIKRQKKIKMKGGQFSSRPQLGPRNCRITQGPQECVYVSVCVSVCIWWKRD